MTFSIFSRCVQAKGIGLAVTAWANHITLSGPLPSLRLPSRTGPLENQTMSTRESTAVRCTLLHCLGVGTITTARPCSHQCAKNQACRWVSRSRWPNCDCIDPFWDFKVIDEITHATTGIHTHAHKQNTHARTNAHACMHKYVHILRCNKP